jgi:hypothetical protein
MRRGGLGRDISFDYQNRKIYINDKEKCYLISATKNYFFVSCKCNRSKDHLSNDSCNGKIHLNQESDSIGIICIYERSKMENLRVSYINFGNHNDSILRSGLKKALNTILK